MVRKKQTPHKAVRLDGEGHDDDEMEMTCDGNSVKESSNGSSKTNVEEVCYARIDKNCSKDGVFGLAEISLSEVEYGKWHLFKQVQSEHGQNLEPTLRLKYEMPMGSSVKMPFTIMTVSARNVFLEALAPVEFLTCSDENQEDAAVSSSSVLLSGRFDGPDESVSALVYLINQEFLTLRMSEHLNTLSASPIFTVHIFITEKAFLASDGILGTGRQPWKKGMMSLMSWLRPEVSTNESIYGPLRYEKRENSNAMRQQEKRSVSDNSFDALAFYNAIQPSKKEPSLDVDFPELVPELRPYQCRASFWMVQREKGDDNTTIRDQCLAIPNPLCVIVESTDLHSKMYYNPFSGSISMTSEGSMKYVHGGILADEMGLGKTVELLACIMAHRRISTRTGSMPASEYASKNEVQNVLKRPKLERVECVCGAVTESYKYTGLWVQCDVCDAWQHAECVGFEKDSKTVTHFKNGTRKQKLKRSNLSKDISDESKSKNFICHTCSELVEISGCEVTSSATLIVCPSPILHQWRDEINRHTSKGSVKVKIYAGVKDVFTESPLDTMITGINDLVDADIVLTTYDVLRSDLSHDFERILGDRRSMRFHKRYPVVPTPLTKICWWRVCLDEAQMVESNVAAAAEMALRLSAQNLWCVTGTPIQQNLEDTYGLLKFLRAEPYDNHKWWTEVIKNPYESGNKAAMQFTHKLFRHLMWRSTKLLVQDELDLPSQEECLSWLTLSPIETHFYKRQHESCAASVHEFIAKCKDDMSKTLKNSDSQSCHPDSEAVYDSQLSHANASRLLNSLLKLRQACCHPQVGSSGLRSLQKSPMTMDEILQVLIGKAKIEGEEALRKCVVAVNGLAALAVIENDFSQAVLLYKEALQLSEGNIEDFRVDPLLKIHTLYNLAEISKKLSSSTDDDILLKESEIIKERYLLQFRTRLCTAQDDFRNNYDQVISSRDVFEKAGGIIWFFECLDYVEEKDLTKDLMIKIRDALSGYDKRLSSRYRDISGLKYTIQTAWDALESSRLALIKFLLDIDKTIDNPRDDDLERIQSCSKCNGSNSNLLCLHCEMDDLFQIYESRLFLLRMGDDRTSVATAEEALNVQKQRSALNRFFGGLSSSVDKKNDSCSMLTTADKNERHRQYKGGIQVSRSPSELETILNIVKKFVKARGSKSMISTANKHMDVFEAMRKEFPHARFLSLAQAQVLRAHDECKMAVSRLRLRLPHEKTNAYGTLCAEELVPTNVNLTGEKFVALAELSHLKGQLRYLKGLSLEKQKQREEESLESESVEQIGNSISKGCNGKKLDKPEQDTCPVCQEKLGKKLMVFPCGHLLCCNCMVSMIHMPSSPSTSRGKRVVCPTCRHRTEYENVAYVDEDQSRQIDQCKHGIYQAVNKAENACIVNGSFGTKIEAVTRRILWITSDDKNSKILVFSSWNDVLDVLEHSLRLNNVNFIRMKGGSNSATAITQFKGNCEAEQGTNHKNGHTTLVKPVQVLLLLFRHGANGLNLLEAQHVILIEPLLNPAEEAQAINRVHRIGQARNTYVHRFIVKETVEESIYKLNKSKPIYPCRAVRSKRDHFTLTLKDVSLLFSGDAHEGDESCQEVQGTGDLRNLAPSVAAVMAAERRQRQLETKL